MTADRVQAGHAYGEVSDCTCGRNFETVRGLREHLTKSRSATEVVADAGLDNGRQVGN